MLFRTHSQNMSVGSQPSGSCAPLLVCHLRDRATLLIDFQHLPIDLDAMFLEYPRDLCGNGIKVMRGQSQYCGSRSR